METFDRVPPSVGAADGVLPVGQMEKMDEHEGGEMWSKLCQELHERIVAKLPFAKLFQVPSLSRAWRDTFRSPTFQEEVMTFSHRWPLYCPVHLSRKRLVGYNAAAQRWEKLFPLSFLPYVPQGNDGVRLCSGAGSLICFARRNKNREREMVRIKQRTCPISSKVYSQCVQAEEVEESMQNTLNLPLGPGVANNFQRVFPPWHPNSEGFQARFLDFRRRLQGFCMADTVDDKLSQETKEFHSYINATLDGPFRYNLGIGEAFDVYVTNVVTKEWKELPSRPCMQRPDIVQQVSVGTKAYKVILMTLLKHWRLESMEGPFRVQIYDSRTDSWALRNSPTTICSLEIIGVETFVYLDTEGVLFIILQGWGDRRVLYEILAYNVEDDTWTRIPDPVAFSNDNFLICGLVVCGSDVMLVTGRSESRAANVDPGLVALGYTGRERLLVYKLEIELMSFEVFSRGPSPGSVEGVSDVDLVIGAGDCVYLVLRSEPSEPSLVFNIRHKLWSTLAPANKSWLCKLSRTTKFAFQPGLNPFLILGTGLGGSAADVGGLAGSDADADELGFLNPWSSIDMEGID